MERRGTIQLKLSCHLSCANGQLDYGILKKFHNQVEIARRLHRSIMTINNELRRSQRYSDKWCAYHYNTGKSANYRKTDSR